MSIETQWRNKRPTRLPEALWTSFKFDAPDDLEDLQGGKPSASGVWRVNVLGQPVDPTDVVVHGSTHLHGTAGDVTYASSGFGLRIKSLDAPLWSTGLLSPFPTPSRASPNVTGPSPFSPSRGLHMNLWNNVWNGNFPTFWPFRVEDGNMRLRFLVDVDINANANPNA